MAAKADKWIQKAKPKPGALSRQLGYPVQDNIPTPVLKKIQSTPTGGTWRGRTITPLIKRRVNFALNMPNRK
jgi:hypothetical protein